MRLLVIDNDPRIREMIRAEFVGSGDEVETAADPASGLPLIESTDPDVVLLDMGLPGAGTVGALESIQAIDARRPVIIITARGTAETAIDAIKAGAFDYFEKPLDLIALRRCVARAAELRRWMSESVALPEHDAAAGGDRLIGHCAAMQEVYKTIGRVAALPVTVLIRGESGTGKELVARAIYANSRRFEQPYLAVNCAAIPDQLLESDLFGHERGSFTGADRRKIGKFEQFGGGTLFLDEIGDMSPPLQAKILRVLQEGSFQRIGGTETIQADVRIIAATNVDLEAAVAAGTFRNDLLYRLNGVTITLPPLRERGADIDLLIEHFTRSSGRDLGRDVRRISDEALAHLRSHGWPGNVRELQNTIRHAVIRSRGPVVEVDDLPLSVLTRPETPVADLSWSFDRFVADRLNAGEDGVYHAALREMERRLLVAALRHVDGNQVQAARRLGLARNTLRAKIREHGIVIDRRVGDADD